MTGSVEQFENNLGLFTGAPYVVATDCCTHAIELCVRLFGVRSTSFTAFTYISVPMTLNLLKVPYKLKPEQWKDEYRFEGTKIWDSARCLRPNMYRPTQYQCLSFGPGKPLNNVRGGAILLDNEDNYKKLKAMVYDGREIGHDKWQDQKIFRQGFHYMMRYEECETAITKLKDYQREGKYEHQYQSYADLRQFQIIN